MNIAAATKPDARAVAKRVCVLLPLPLAGPYDYVVPAELTVGPGDYVRVPLGPVTYVGVVWGEAAPEAPKVQLRAILERLPAPPMPALLREFIDWVARYNCAPQGAVLRLAIRGRRSFDPPPIQTQIALGPDTPARMTPARSRVLAIAGDGKPRTLAALCEEAEVSAAVIRKLIDDEALVRRDLSSSEYWPSPDPDFATVALNAAQREAASVAAASVKANDFCALLLDGVTGSGKTEVYFEAVDEVLRGNGQALILLPEIALTHQFLERFKARFGVAPGAWHSSLTSTERRRTWQAIAEGRIRVVVGARSALFLPFPKLKLIVVDEEHERAYKQEDGVLYNARDMAVIRAKLGSHPVILCSATPSLETHVNAQSERYRRLTLSKRFGDAEIPPLTVIDLRATPPDTGQFLSPPLVDAVSETIARGEQALLFLNRRGYAPLTLCRRCGHRMKCPACSAWLVHHRYRARLICHHCGHERVEPKRCPACEGESTLAPCGPGIERVAEEATARFPDARLTLLSSDSHPKALMESLAAIEQGLVDIVIGTQIVAKGHHFPNLTLAGIVDADLGLEGGDLRAAERSFQLIHQVAGRTGRAERKGRALLQTYQPDHPVMRALASGDRDAFIGAETQMRREGGLPPFGRLAALVLAGPDPEALARFARALSAQSRPPKGVQILGPAPAPLALLRGRHRMRFLIKAERQIDLSAYLAAWTRTIRPPASVRLTVDVDPVSFL